MGIAQRNVFLTGGTGYMGRALAEELVRRGHRVRALVRAGSEGKVASGCELVHGDALRAVDGNVRRRIARRERPPLTVQVAV